MKRSFFQILSEYSRALIGAIILAILIRGFVFEPFKIPSPSMVPNLLVGDHIFVKRYAYGLRVPFTKYWLAEFSDPKRGDVIVFNYPMDEDINFVKRVVGIPGDVVKMEAGQLYVNGQKILEEPIAIRGENIANKCWVDLEQESLSKVPEKALPIPYHKRYPLYQKFVETFENDHRHVVQRSKTLPLESDFEKVVPERRYFVLGDNRDESKDSRFWGFVPRENLKGKAEFIWLSLNSEGVPCRADFGFGIRWDRFGKRIW